MIIYSYYSGNNTEPYTVISTLLSHYGPFDGWPSLKRIKDVLVKQPLYTKLFLDDNGEIVMRLTVEEG